jgi:hypothetical protein
MIIDQIVNALLEYPYVLATPAVVLLIYWVYYECRVVGQRKLEEHAGSSRPSTSKINYLVDAPPGEVNRDVSVEGDSESNILHTATWGWLSADGTETKVEINLYDGMMNINDDDFLIDETALIEVRCIYAEELILITEDFEPKIVTGHPTITHRLGWIVSVRPNHLYKRAAMGVSV